MAKIMIVPASDYEVFKKYLLPSVVLIPEHFLNTISPEAKNKVKELERCEDVHYDFGGEPDINMDIVLCEDSYAYNKLIRKKSEEEDD